MCHEPATPTIVSGYDLRLLGIKTEKVFKESGSVKRMGETMDGWDIPARRKLLSKQTNYEPSRRTTVKREGLTWWDDGKG